MRHPATAKEEECNVKEGTYRDWWEWLNFKLECRCHHLQSNAEVQTSLVFAQCFREYFVVSKPWSREKYSEDCSWGKPGAYCMLRTPREPMKNTHREELRLSSAGHKERRASISLWVNLEVKFPGYVEPRGDWYLNHQLCYKLRKSLEAELLN